MLHLEDRLITSSHPYVENLFEHCVPETRLHLLPHSYWQHNETFHSKPDGFCQTAGIKHLSYMMDAFALLLGLFGTRFFSYINL